MKKLLFPLISSLAIVAMLLTGCGDFRIISGSGNVVDKQYDLQGFSAIDASYAFVVDVTRSDAYSVVVSARQNIIDYLDVAVSGGTLKLQLKPGTYTNADLKASVTVPELKSLNLSGASGSTVSGFASGDDFNLVLSGASHADIDMETGKTDIEISGASRVAGQLKSGNTRMVISGASHCELNGSANDIDLEVSGASHATLHGFPVSNAALNVSGASGASLKTDGTMNVRVSGASFVDYYGSPTLNEVNVTGASRLNKK